MITGAAQADAAILADRRRDGMQEQSRRHGYLLHLLGIRQIVVAVNKMDLVGYSEARFEEVAGDVRAYLADLGVDLRTRCIIPVSARDGDNIASARSRAHALVHGPDARRGARRASAAGHVRPSCRCACRCRTSTSSTSAASSPGRIESGQLRDGRHAAVLALATRPARVASIEAWNVPGADRGAGGPASRSASRSTSRSSSSAARSRASSSDPPIEQRLPRPAVLARPAAADARHAATS